MKLAEPAIHKTQTEWLPFSLSVSAYYKQTIQYNLFPLQLIVMLAAKKYGTLFENALQKLVLCKKEISGFKQRISFR